MKTKKNKKYSNNILDIAKMVHKHKMNKHESVNKKKRYSVTQRGGAGDPPIDFASLSPQDLQALADQGITPEQIKELQAEQTSASQQPPPGMDMGQPPPGMDMGQPPPGMDMGQPPPPAQLPSKTDKYPAMMGIAAYDEFRKVDKAERKRNIGAQKPNAYGYVFSDLISDKMLRDMKRTQGSFLVGVNLSNLFDEFRSMVVETDTNSKRSSQSKQKEIDNKKLMLQNNPDTMFNKLGEWFDIDINVILDKKMGERGSGVPLLPEVKLTDYSTFYEIIDESKKYANRSGFNGKITPYGLLVMCRMLFKYKKTNAQWFRVATILELIYKYLGIGQPREEFFKTRDDIPILSLMDLEEFYNTDHIFMTDKELAKFKEDLKYYKNDPNIELNIELNKKLKKVKTLIK